MIEDQFLSVLFLLIARLALALCLAYAAHGESRWSGTRTLGCFVRAPPWRHVRGASAYSVALLRSHLLAARLDMQAILTYMIHFPQAFFITNAMELRKCPSRLRLGLPPPALHRRPELWLPP
jgi:hypothetical protein